MEEINALPIAEQPQNLGHEVVPPPPFNMEAVSAQLRYSVPPEARFAEGSDWSCMMWLHGSRRRFQSVTFDRFLYYVQNEQDHGRHRFDVYYHRQTGRWWARAISRNERRGVRA